MRWLALAALVLLTGLQAAAGTLTLQVRLASLSFLLSDPLLFLTGGAQGAGMLLRDDGAGQDFHHAVRGLCFLLAVEKLFSFFRLAQ